MDKSSRISVRTLKTDTLSSIFKVYFIGWGTRLLLAQWLVSLGVRLLLETPTWIDGALALGVFLWWPLQEWIAHLYILHARPLLLRCVGPECWSLQRPR